jgi:hypothetical protein
MGNLYQSEEWKSLEEIDRAQLLLVIEGIKRGTIIGGNWTSFMKILEKTGLGYELNTNKYQLSPVVVVARPEDLQEQNRRYLTLPENANRDDFHKIAGWLLGYPECCTAEYVKDRTLEQRRAQRNGQRHLSYRFGQELDAQIKAKRSYSEILDYRPPSFTPCGVECPEATRVLTSWKQAIDTLDPEAGRELVYFNRRCLPERFAHQEYLQQEGQRRSLEYRLEMLRRSVR